MQKKIEKRVSFYDDGTALEGVRCLTDTYIWYENTFRVWCECDVE